ncbi:MAG TPA: hypothetical protein VKU60_10200, partial [Chloroflexota bacterium]|nr:hypothetical protein [Chloroflexota bacterium]
KPSYAHERCPKLTAAGQFRFEGGEVVLETVLTSKLTQLAFYTSRWRRQRHSDRQAQARLHLAHRFGLNAVFAAQLSRSPAGLGFPSEGFASKAVLPSAQGQCGAPLPAISQSLLLLGR